MIEKKIGFIGCGHMASAIIEGLVESGACSGLKRKILKRALICKDFSFP